MREIGNTGDTSKLQWQQQPAHNPAAGFPQSGSTPALFFFFLSRRATITCEQAKDPLDSLGPHMGAPLVHDMARHQRATGRARSVWVGFRLPRPLTSVDHGVASRCRAEVVPCDGPERRSCNDTGCVCAAPPRHVSPLPLPLALNAPRSQATQTHKPHRGRPLASAADGGFGRGRDRCCWNVSSTGRQ